MRFAMKSFYKSELSCETKKATSSGKREYTAWRIILLMERMVGAASA